MYFERRKSDGERIVSFQSTVSAHIFSKIFVFLKSYTVTVYEMKHAILQCITYVWRPLALSSCVGEKININNKKEPTKCCSSSEFLCSNAQNIQVNGRGTEIEKCAHPPLRGTWEGRGVPAIVSTKWGEHNISWLWKSQKGTILGHFPVCEGSHFQSFRALNARVHVCTGTTKKRTTT